MITILFKYLICKFFGHRLNSAGSCPYTGLAYDYCERCESMIPKSGDQ
jgi:hypothetical protein